MKTRMRYTTPTLLALAALGALIAGCAAAPGPASEAVVVTEEVVEKEEVAVVVTAAATQEAHMALEDEVGGDGRTNTTLPYRANRLIIKNAELTLLVADTDNALDLTAQIAGDTGGYILSSRVWYKDWLDESYKYATVTLSVPADQFEPTMRRLRQMALRVEDETASGQDVTDQYVDLQSRLENLQATRDRIRTFLDQAETVEEAMQVNDKLAEVEGEIERVQGRMNYLFDRAAYSTITIQLTPELPEATPTPTPTPTPQPSWDPGESAARAGDTLGAILRVLAEIAIWVGIVVLPLLAPPMGLLALIGWIWRRISRRKKALDSSPGR